MSPEHGHARNLLDCLTIPQPIPPGEARQRSFLSAQCQSGPTSPPSGGRQNNGCTKPVTLEEWEACILSV